MSENNIQKQGQDFPLETRSPIELVDLLCRFDGPPEAFLSAMLAVQCRFGSVKAGCLMRASGEEMQVLSGYPVFTEESLPDWLNPAAKAGAKALQQKQTLVTPLHSPHDLYGAPAKQNIIAVPLNVENMALAGAFLVETNEIAIINSAKERLEMSSGFLRVYEMRNTLKLRSVELDRLRHALELLPIVNEHERFVAAAMAFVNEASSRWRCERASLGFLKGRYVELRAMSHTDKFSRKMKLVQDIEAAMEECLDQDLEVLYPSSADTAAVTRSTEELSRRHGPTAVVSLPMRRNGEVQAVLTLERPANEPFSTSEIESIRLACELCTTRLLELHEHDRWFGARLASVTRKAIAGALGPKHTWKKIIAIAAAAIIVFFSTAEGDYTADGSFILETDSIKLVSAPFDGELEDVKIEPDDLVKAGDTLAVLKTAEMKYRLAAARADKAMYEKQAASAMRDDKRAEAQIAEAQAERTEAEIQLLEYQIEKANITAPIDGKILSGDLKRQIGAPVKTGTLLFEMAPPGSFRAQIAVPEDQIPDVKVGQAGTLAAAAAPENKLDFQVEHISPMAEIADQQNVFKVRVKLLENEPWMRPGIEGLAKIKVERRLLISIWTRKLVNWVRMKLWL